MPAVEKNHIFRFKIAGLIQTFYAPTRQEAKKMAHAWSLKVYGEAEKVADV